MEIGCPTCGRTLRLAEEHAGKQIRCPACQQISIAPGKTEFDGNEPAAVENVTVGSATTWHLRMPEGPIYGPIDWTEVLAWAGEGRINGDCELADERSGPWRKAVDVLPPSVLPRSEPAVAAAPAAYPFGGGAPAFSTSSTYVAPHRGGLVLVLGLLSWVACPLVSFAAWVMGSHDLREMRAGRMDRSGESATFVGMIFGMIISGLWLLAGVVLAAVLLIIALLR
jgi:hypothetical protein